MKFVGLAMTVGAEGQALRRRSTMTRRCSRAVPPTVLSCPRMMAAIASKAPAVAMRIMGVL
jgi:hypothetical protein